MAADDAKTGDVTPVLKAHNASQVMAATPTTLLNLFTCAEDKNLYYDSFMHRLALPPKANHRNPVLDVAITDDGKFIVSAGDDSLVRVWDAGSGKLQHRLIGHTAPVNAVVVFRSAAMGNERTHTVASGSNDGTIKLWNLTPGWMGVPMNASIDAHGPVSCLAVWPDGSRLVAGHNWSSDKEHNHAVTAWALQANGKGAQLQHVFHGHTNAVRSVAVRGDLIVSGSRDRTVKVWSLSQHQMKHTLIGHDHEVTGVAIHGDTVISTSLDRTWRLWNVHSGQLIATHHSTTNSYYGFYSLAVTANRVVLGAQYQSIVVCSLSTGKVLLDVPNAHSDRVQGLAVRGDTVVSASNDSTVKTWEISSASAPLGAEELQHIIQSIKSGTCPPVLDLSGRDVTNGMAHELITAIADQDNCVVYELDLSYNKLSHFPVEPLLLSPYNVLHTLQSVRILGTDVKNIPATFHYDIAPLLRSRVNRSLFEELGVVLPKDLGAWEPEHVLCWAEKLNLSPRVRDFLAAAGVSGAMLNAPKHRVVTILQSCRRRLQAQAPTSHALQQVASQAMRLRETAHSVGPSTTRVMNVLGDCLRDPVLHPDHPGHDTLEKRTYMHGLRAALQALYGPDANDILPAWAPVCGSLPADKAFRDRLRHQRQQLLHLLENWRPTGDMAERFNVFNMELLRHFPSYMCYRPEEYTCIPTALMMVRRGKPHRRPHVWSRLRPTGVPGDGKYEDVDPPPKAKQFIVHYRSKHPHLTPQLLQQAYESWLSLLYAELEVIDERGTPAAAEPKLQCTHDVDHVYVEDEKLAGQTAAAATLPGPNVCFYTIKISEHVSNDKDAFSWWSLHGNALGCLRHEIGHTLGFMHENTASAAAAVDWVAGGYDVVLAVGSPKMDRKSVMLYTKLWADCKTSTPTPLSKRDTWGCRNFFSPLAHAQ